MSMLSTWDDDDDFMEPLEALKQASASLELHESASCACLLPCGLLPEELEDLEELQLGPKGKVLGAGLKVEATLSLKSISLHDALEVPAPLTPQGAAAPAPTAARLLRYDSDEGGVEEEGEEGEEGAEAVLSDPSSASGKLGATKEAVEPAIPTNA